MQTLSELLVERSHFKESLFSEIKKFWKVADKNCIGHGGNLWFFFLAIF